MVRTKKVAHETKSSVVNDALTILSWWHIKEKDKNNSADMDLTCLCAGACSTCAIYVAACQTAVGRFSVNKLGISPTRQKHFAFPPREQQAKHASVYSSVLRSSNNRSWAATNENSRRTNILWTDTRPYLLQEQPLNHLHFHILRRINPPCKILDQPTSGRRVNHAKMKVPVNLVPGN